ncbi:hypothetical protein CC86DRAFT_395259 [Ophiobolus disseminans]|uniref:Uncharacterized protein n=1 Tax=Ophiobolus disseminans TaxID=1469910 RepID=A0A6A6ZUV2_9PLEO|nr:hypothetical protein CC86DRAFT_395259 [Ophiobolus disseminans]
MLHLQSSSTQTKRHDANDYQLSRTKLRNSLDNIVEHRNRGPNSVHFAAWINYYTKAEELTFYNDEYDNVELIKLPSCLRQRLATKTKAQYEERLAYYTDKILLLHRNNRYNWYLIEDNDPSYGNRNPRSLLALYRCHKGVERLMHLANSPDLNPIEGIWNIVKERVRCKLHNINTIDEFKAVLQREWKAMPYCIGQVFTHPDKRCKTSLW